MHSENDIKEIVNKYMKGECSREELEAALKLFDDPYHNLALRPALYEQWNKNAEGAQEKLNEEESSSILDKIHRRIHFEQENKPRRSSAWKIIGTVSKIAAILVIGLFLGLSV
ncbi:MAG TPA: hypothetical protein VKA10_09340, partial [Prolixibacteraceae bacterium]|nr:hypothetical protein [Prolixibacteraceae bacterium]